MTEAALSSPLEAELRRLISVAGPIPVWKFMSLCLTHPQHGYYVTRDPFGVAGDFTTAPEISQIFGELLGVWALSVWRIMGSPENVRLVELGPGRGTMMKDALRALRVAPEFRNAISLHLVEASPVLERMQRDMLESTDVPILWHRTFEDVPDGPMIILANEFVDALPVHQDGTSGWSDSTAQEILRLAWRRIEFRISSACCRRAHARRTSVPSTNGVRMLLPLIWRAKCANRAPR
jgi:NADH dehydrogenase [ubiquinone] 1 alpha subcomplex assembly factor 7